MEDVSRAEDRLTVGHGRLMRAGGIEAVAASREVPGGKSYGAVKRVLDLFAATVALLLAAPLMGVVAILIRAGSPGPALIRQMRVGRQGVEFELLKFRTMRQGADEDLEDALIRDPELRLTWQQFQKLVRDPRLTGIGRWLRRYSVDELPQLWNVVRGEMSLVGPRPFLPQQRAFYGPAIEEYATVRPGMTGLWQVRGRNRLSFDERVELDLEYLRQRSLRFDLWILARTVAVVIHATGAF